MNGLNADRRTRGILDVASVWRKFAAERDQAIGKARCEAVIEVAETLRAEGEALRNRLEAEIKELLLPIDPLHFSWSSFGAFGHEEEEPRWTKWMAALLRRARHRCPAGTLAWKAFCNAVERQVLATAPEATADTRGLLAGAEDWRGAAGESIAGVERETGEKELGYVDLIASTQSLLAVVEFKVRAHWHDWGAKEAELQAVRYRRIGLLRRSPQQKLGLVLVSALEDLSTYQVTDHTDDYVMIGWQDIAIEMRRLLGPMLHESISPAGLLQLWPAIETISAIERHLIGLEHPLPQRQGISSWIDLSQARELLSHLQGTINE